MLLPSLRVGLLPCRNHRGTHATTGTGARRAVPGPYAVVPSATSFDIATNQPWAMLPISVAGQLELRTADNGFTRQPGVLRGGMPSTTINNNPTCFADRPEVATFDGRFVVAWQERCGAGPWKVYLRYAE